MRNGRCRMHGGKSPAGIASPHFKTGRYSSVIPTHLATSYEQALADPDLLGIAEDIRLQDALLRNALDAMSRGEAGELWVQLKEQWALYQKAKKDPKQNEQDALYMIGFLIKEGYQDYMARIEVRHMLQERSRLVEAEGKRMERAQQTLTTNQAMTLAQALLQAVLAHVSDRDTLDGIQRDFIRVVGLDNSRRATSEQAVLSEAGP